MVVGQRHSLYTAARENLGVGCGAPEGKALLLGGIARILQNPLQIDNGQIIVPEKLRHIPEGIIVVLPNGADKAVGTAVHPGIAAKSAVAHKGKYKGILFQIIRRLRGLRLHRGLHRGLHHRLRLRNGFRGNRPRFHRLRVVKHAPYAKHSKNKDDDDQKDS